MERIEDGQCSEEGRIRVYDIAYRFGLSCSLSLCQLIPVRNNAFGQQF